MAGVGAPPSDWRQRYDAAMADAASRYQDVLDLLRSRGFQAEMIQTGGMCLAISWPAPNDGYYLLTNREEPLAWDRDPDNGWALGRYEGDDDDLVGEVAETELQTADTALVLALAARRAEAPA